MKHRILLYAVLLASLIVAVAFWDRYQKPQPQEPTEILTSIDEINHQWSFDSNTQKPLVQLTAKDIGLACDFDDKTGTGTNMTPTLNKALAYASSWSRMNGSVIGLSLSTKRACYAESSLIVRGFGWVVIENLMVHSGPDVQYAVIYYGRDQ